MVPRNLEKVLLELAGYYPVVTVTGPRQSGKTTLCRQVFTDRQYVSLEPLDVREQATRDPRGFLAPLANGAVIDEVQHAPGLLSYLQVEVDRNPAPGRFILTGSQHLGLTAAASQSLAGRTGVVHLLPLGLDELRRFPGAPQGLLETLWAGAYPRIHDQHVPADRWLSDYVATYVQRDLRQLLRVGDLQAFTSFLRLCAGRTGQVLNLSALGADAGVSHNTARAWLSVLEASFLVLRLPAWERNLRRQLTRAPKLHFLDSGLACHLLGIREPAQLAVHPLRGAVFESWVVGEVAKARAHAGQALDLFHFRDHRGFEVDLVVEAGARVLLAEMKSGATLADDFFGPLDRLAGWAAPVLGGRTLERRLIYGGEERRTWGATEAIPWHEVVSAGWLDR